MDSSPAHHDLPGSNGGSRPLPVAQLETTPLLRAAAPSTIADPDQDTTPPHPLRAIWLESRLLLRHMLPVVGANLLEYSLVVASIVSLGHLSTDALAAAALGGMTAGVTGFSIVYGFCTALDTLLPAAWTSAQPNLVGLWAQRMAVVQGFVLVPVFVMWMNAESILLALKQDPEIARLAAVYLRYLSLGLPAFAFNTIARRYFQSQGLFTIPTQIFMVISPINAFLNYLLVWGPPPFRLGFIGAPLAIAGAMNLNALCCVAYGILFVPRTAWHPIGARSFTQLGLVARLGLAGVGQVASEWWTWEIMSLAASFVGPKALATQSVLLVSASTTFQAPYALSVVATVRIGNLLGQQRARAARVAAHTSLVLSLAIAIILGTIFVVFRSSWGRLFNDDPDVISLVASILPLVALSQIFDGISASSGGIFRARGKQHIGAMLNLSAYYAIGIPCGIWLAFPVRLGLAGIWIGLCAGLVVIAGVGMALALRTDWSVEVRRALDRIAADKKAHVEQGAVV